MSDNSLAAIDYIKRLQRLIEFEATFTFAHYKIVNASRIDDLMACILGALPENYKKALQKKNNSVYSSVVAYNALTKILKQKFFLFPGSYVIDSVEAKSTIEAIVKNLDNDLFNIDNN